MPLNEGNWATNSHSGALTAEKFDTLHGGLTVDLVATPRNHLLTCRVDQKVADVLEVNTEPFDFLPVEDGTNEGGIRIVGLLNATAPALKNSREESVNPSLFLPLCENLLIGAGASILDFVLSADTQPCRLVVSGGHVSGLVGLSDMQKLPVRAALFALITGFEMVMVRAIETKLPDDEWKKSLSLERAKKIDEQIQKSKNARDYVNSLLFTQFCDKATILRKHFNLGESKKTCDNELNKIQSLRDDLAHANQYASTQDRAKEVCATIRNLRKYREKLITEISGN